ncbi:T9SS type A sorting domain-containing protein [Hymenobacter busanensis]|uniref:T9SS type A sorting domain-containing protein n=1 Tax=Hymenobacter busanensis TaxID=2607656 RepID=A0A7L4ZS50_9BACT|nr:IPT/TIG domain-containing protein [Hymenobacter busanensis]KAA9327185.1 T9SS type A sorting domain-containing protein [Hymenobacter busanensis]QHJ05851.1 T9SS type A sorting domain-containing protein [Hymenobacter busanensis]
MDHTLTRVLRSYAGHSRRWLTAIMLLCLPLASWAQSLTQADFTGVIVPQYMGSATATRLPVVYRATVTNLTPGTVYRYYSMGATNATTGGGTVDIGGTGTGAGNPLLISPNGATYSYTSAPNLTTAGNYESFTTDASGSYTGWFAFVNTGNARFTGGNVVYPTLTLAKDATPAVIEKKLALDQGITVLTYSATAGTANSGTFIKGASSATPKNVVALYDNTAGTGRPLTVAVVENIGVTIGSAVTGYSTTAGSWNSIIPNTLPNGVRRVEERSVTTGSVLNCNTDGDGTWPSGAVTVNPLGGSATPIQLTATDAPLNAGCGTAVSPAVTVSTTGPLTFSTTQGTPSAVQTYTVSGSSLAADITVTAPSGFEVSSNGTTFSTSLTLPQTGGTVASTTISVRLIGGTVGTPSGNISNTSGTATQNVAVSGTVNAPAPTVSSFTPTTGPVGTVVTINGTGFTGTTRVTFNGTTATTFNVLNSTQISATVPTGATTGTIAVTTPGGTGTSTGTFTVTTPVALPTISSFTPTSGPVGTVVTITGTNFTSAATVSFNGTAATGVTFVSATQLTATVPAGATTGPIAVTVGSNTATSATPFTVTPTPNPVPTITSLAPATAVAGGAAFTLTVNGTNFLASSVVNFNNTALTTSFVSATQLTAAVPATAVATAGSYNVTVTNPAPGGGTSAASTFTVTPRPTALFEDFEAGVKASYTAGTVTLSSGDWLFTDALIGTTAGSDRFNGTKSARIRGGGSIAMAFDKTNGAGTVTVNAGLYGNDAPASIKVEISTDGGTTYSDITGTAPLLSNTLTSYTFAANRAGNVRLRISSTNTTAGTNPRLNVDDVTISDFVAPTTATILTSPSTLTGFTTAPGVASAVRSYVVTGYNLAVPITVTAPAGFEVSLSATTGFGSSVSISSGPAAGTTVYVRVAANAGPGTVSGNITHVSGTTTQTLPVSGSVVLAARNALAARTELYPNPATDVLHVQLRNAAPGARVSLSDLLGRVVLDQPLPANGEVRLTNLAAGTYVLTLESNGQLLTRKIVKQ